MICELYRILVSNKFVVRTSLLFSYVYNEPKKLRQWVWNSYLAEPDLEKRFETSAE